MSDTSVLAQGLSPKARKAIQVGLAVAGLIVGTAIVVDANTPLFDLTAYTTPISAGLLYLGSVLGLVVTVPNIPTAPAAPVFPPTAE